MSARFCTQYERNHKQTAYDKGEGRLVILLQHVILLQQLPQFGGVHGRVKTNEAEGPQRSLGWRVVGGGS